jgi:hypothetical protein
VDIAIGSAVSIRGATETVSAQRGSSGGMQLFAELHVWVVLTCCHMPVEGRLIHEMVLVLVVRRGGLILLVAAVELRLELRLGKLVVSLGGEFPTGFYLFGTAEWRVHLLRLHFQLVSYCRVIDSNHHLGVLRVQKRLVVGLVVQAVGPLEVVSVLGREGHLASAAAVGAAACSAVGRGRSLGVGVRRDFRYGGGHNGIRAAVLRVHGGSIGCRICYWGIAARHLCNELVIILTDSLERPVLAKLKRLECFCESVFRPLFARQRKSRWLDLDVQQHENHDKLNKCKSGQHINKTETQTSQKQFIK